MPKHTLLIVEDETLIRMSVSEYLQEFGFKTLEASSGHEAQQILQATDVDLVLTDIRTDGELDGIALAKWIGANKPNLPVVFISGNATLVNQELGKGRHALLKPVNYEAMVTLIRRLLSHPETGQAN